MSTKNILKQADLIEWIHRFDRKKRTYATITELFLERVLLPKIISGPVSTGWAYWPLRDGTRVWIRLNWTLSGLTNAEVELVKKLYPVGHRFFVIDGACIFQGRSDSVPEASLTVSEVGLHAGTLTIAPSADCPKIVQGVGHYLRSGKAWAAPEDGVCIRKWLEQCAYQDIVRIFLSRCILNGYRPEDCDGGPVDVDAIYLARLSQQLEFLEFKKKDAASGMYCIGQNADFDEMLDTALQHNRTPKPLIKAFCRALKWKRGPCFGLDSDSHAQNVSFCESHGIRYRHLIWDNSPSTPMNDLLDEYLNPVRPVILRHALVTTRDFGGINYSPPWDSSNIGRGNDRGLVRTQLMLPQKLFSKVVHALSRLPVPTADRLT